MIVCPRCSKDNQDHYKFCLGCGAELPRAGGQQPKSFTAPTPPSGMPAVSPGPADNGAAQAAASDKAAARSDEGAQGGNAAGASAAPPSSGPGAGGGGPSFGGGSVAAAGVASGAAAAPSVPAPAASPESLTCPQCSASVPATFKFCGSCGFKMENVKQAASPAAAPAAPAAAPAAQPDETPSRGSLVLIRPDGSEGDTFPLSDGSTTLGRETSPMFQGDTFLSPTHATFAFEGSSLTVTDEDSLNGVYLRVNRDEPVELPDGAIFRIGQEILRFERLTAPNDPPGEEYMGSPDPGFLGRIRLVVGPDSYGNAYCIPPAGMHLGRERGDVIFPEDGYVSGLHCRLDSQGGKVFLTDVGSSNGTFIRVRGQAPVPSGTLLLMGQQLFRVEY